MEAAKAQNWAVEPQGKTVSTTIRAYGVAYRKTVTLIFQLVLRKWDVIKPIEIDIDTGSKDAFCNGINENSCYKHNGIFSS
jgi:hypothetical protein